MEEDPRSLTSNEQVRYRDGHRHGHGHNVNSMELSPF
jgi:hypothetical protein